MFGLISAGMAFAAVQDSRFEINRDDMNVALEVQNIPRREVLERIFADTEVAFKWLNPAFADELVSGTFNGTMPGIARQLLAQTDFALVYERAGDESRIVQVLIVGRAQAGQTAPGLAALAAALPLSDTSQAQSAKPKEIRKAQSPGLSPIHADKALLVPEFRKSSGPLSFPARAPSDVAGSRPFPIASTGPAMLVPIPADTAPLPVPLQGPVPAGPAMALQPTNTALPSVTPTAAAPLPSNGTGK
jgi:hypothetical protein